MISEVKNPWEILDTVDVYESDWISLVKHNVLDPKKNKAVYSIVKFKHTAIGVLPLDKDLNTWIVGQYRFPINKYSWEIPEGGGSLSEAPVEAAKRELSEEVGISAKKYTLIQEFNTTNSCTDEKAYLYVAQDLSFHDSHPDDNEELKVKKIPFEKLYQMVLNGEITDSLTIIAAHKTKYLLENNKL